MHNRPCSGFGVMVRGKCRAGGGRKSTYSYAMSPSERPYCITLRAS